MTNKIESALKAAIAWLEEMYGEEERKQALALCKSALADIDKCEPVAWKARFIEKCAKVAMDMPMSIDEIHEYRASDDSKAMAWDISHAIRALKEVK